MKLKQTILKKPDPPRVRIYLSGVGWICNKKLKNKGCRMIKYHKGFCKHNLSLWELIKRQFGYE